MAFTVQYGFKLCDEVSTLMLQLDTRMCQNGAITGASGSFLALATQEIGRVRTQPAAGGGAAAAKPSVNLADLKGFKPDGCSSKRDQDYKPWRKRFPTYCNMQCPGLSAALNWVEKLDIQVDDAALQRLAWDKAAETNPKCGTFRLSHALTTS